MEKKVLKKCLKNEADLNKYFTIEDKQQQKKKKKEKKSKLIYPDIDSSQRLGNRVWANKVKIKR